MLKFNIGDRLLYHSSQRVEVFRMGRSLGVYSCSLPLQKRAAPAPDPEQKHDPKLPPNSHWITVHGDASGGGTPVLVRDNPDGSASVIGGAGGKLNHLRIKLRSPEEWKQKAKERAAAKKEKESQQTSGQKDEKQKAKEHHQTRKQENAIATFNTLKEHGITSPNLTDEHIQALSTPPPADATPEEQKRWRQLSNEAVRQVRQIHQAYEHRLVTDHEARAAAFLGDSLGDVGKKLVSDSPHQAATENGEAIASLQPLPNGQWLASSTNPDEQPQVFDSWRDAAKAHVRNVLAQEQEVANGDRTQPDEFYDPAQWVQAQDGVEFNPQAAAKIAALSNERKSINRSAKQAERAIEQGQMFTAPAYDAPNSDAVLASIETEAKTLEDAVTNNNFLNLVDQGDVKYLKPAIANGGYGSLADIASEVLKQNPVSREMVEILGHNEAAKVVAYQIGQATTPEEYDRITKAHAAFHARTSTRIAKATAERVKPMMGQLAQLHQRVLELEAETGGNYSPNQQIELDNLTYQSEQLNSNIQRIVGEAVGKLQASAAMVQALESKPRSLKVTPEAAEKLELEFSDYENKGNQYQVNEAGIQKLAVGYSPEDRQAYDEALAIKKGDYDESQYLPAGFVYRPNSSFAVHSGDGDRFHADLALTEKMEPEAMQDALKSYIGGRVANGDNPLDVLTDVRSPELYLSQGLDPYGKLALAIQGAANDLVLQAAGDGKISDKAIRSAFQELGDAEAAKQRRARQTDDLQALHSQTLNNTIAIESAHRALAADPMARVAFKDWEQTTGQERRWLRDYAITNILGQELEARSPKKQSQDEPAPEQEMQADLFGGFTSAAEVAASQREGANEPELTQWQQFSKLMGGDRHAYEATLDQLRGQYLNRFAQSYGAIANKPLLIGGQNLSQIERVLLAKLPEAERNEILEFMRSRDRSEQAKAQGRSRGRFAVDDAWMERYEALKGDNRQISLLQADTGRSTPKTDYQRTTLGDKAEQQLGDLLRSKVIPNFEQVNGAIDLIPEVSWGADTPHVTKQRASKFIQARKKVGIWFGAGSGKCLGKGTPVLMFDGSIKKIENIAEGDQVMGWDSQPRTVLGTTSGIDELYRITPVKGDSWICNSEHILTLIHSPTGEVIDIPLPDYLEAIQGENKPHSVYRGMGSRFAKRIVRDCKQLRSGVEFEAQGVPLDPYLAGLWLGDGTKTAPVITNCNQAIVDYCVNLGRKTNHKVSATWIPAKNTNTIAFANPHGRGGYYDHESNKVREAVKTMVDEDSQKRILPCYLQNHSAIRLQILAGLLDTDGYVDRGSFEFTTKYEGLKDDFLYLCRSLGFAAYATLKRSTIKSLNFVGYYWRVSLSGDFSRIPCKIHKLQPRKQKKDVLRTGFTVSPIGKGEYFGFELDGDGRFLLGDFTVTHNSSIALGAFSDLHDRGEVKRMIVAVPSAILGQFVGEGVNFLKPGTYNYSANIGWDKADRHAALADPNQHIHITTRESLANDLLAFVEKHTGVKPEEFMERPEADRHQLMGAALQGEGIDPSSLMLAVDEAHDISQRKGVDASKRSLAIEAAAHHSSHYVEFTGTPLKNDPSEAFSVLNRLAPEKFSDRAQFMKQYGSGSDTSRRALQRAIAPYVYSASTKPRDSNGRTLQMREQQPKVGISEHQSQERQRILDDYKTVASYYSAKRKEYGAQISKEQLADAWDNKPVREAIARLASDDTYGSMSEEEQKEAIAGQVMGGAGIKEKALWRLYHRTPYENNPKAQETIKQCQEHLAKGKAGVVFTASSQAAQMLKDQMAKQGIKVGLIDGSMSPEQKTAERLKFSPAKGGKPEYDILICTDACQTGLNLQRGKFLVHYDVPLTQKAYDQRSARIHRFRQDEDTTIITPLLDVPEEAIAWSRMQRKGNLGAVYQAKAEMLDDTGLAGEIQRIAG